MNPTLEVVISVYNQPEYTRLVLESYLRQSDRDFSVALADDGSGPEIARLVEEFRERGLAIRHLWHADRGFRKAEIVNRTIAGSTADYIVLTDNDCMAQREFVADHKRAACRGNFVVGRRVNLNSTLSERFVDGVYGIERVDSRAWLLAGAVCGHLEYPEVGLRIPFWLSRLISRKGPKLLGANTGVWRDDLVAVNGYDEAFVGYGYEDVDLDWRLRAMGLQAQSVKGRAGVIHLYHPQRKTAPDNVDLLQARRHQGIYRVARGIVRE